MDSVGNKVLVRKVRDDQVVAPNMAQPTRDGPSQLFGGGLHLERSFSSQPRARDDASSCASRSGRTKCTETRSAGSKSAVIKTTRPGENRR